MSLISIIGTSTQALFNTETQIAIASQNIGNAQNPDYVQRNASVIDNGSPAGVVDVSRQVSTALQQELFGQSGVSAGQSYLDQIYQQLEQLTGSAAGTPGLSSAMQSFVGAYQAYEAQPESASAQSAVTQAAQGLVGAVQTVANGIETIAGQVQTQTEADVGSLNGDLTQIGALNAQIISATAAGKPTADLEDQRDALVSDVATLVPVKATPTANGGLDLTTPDGVSLVGGTNAAQFSYTPYTLGTNGTAGTDASITLSDQPGSNLDATFASGKIGAELNIMRVDDAGAASTDPAVAPLEKVRRQLDDFVDQFYSSNPATPTAFQSAYNTGLAAGAPGLDLFVVQNQGPGGQPQPAGGDRFGFELNPLIANGTASLNQGSANAVVQALTSNSSSTALSAGDIQNFSGSISALADAIASSQTRRAAQADSNSQAATASYGATQTAYSNATGVSMDAQLADLITLQNSFNASAKVISVASSLVQTLFQSIG